MYRQLKWVESMCELYGIRENKEFHNTTLTCQPHQCSKKAAPQQRKKAQTGVWTIVWASIYPLRVTRWTGAQDRSQASTGMSFSFSNCFLLLLLTIITHRFTMKPNDGMKKGPNDARRVVWAFSKFFYSFICFIFY